MAVSIADVAKRAGVSGGTVSHVLNNNGGARIAPATQERVRAAAAHLGYQPNRLARSLGRQRTDTLGLMISGLQNPFFVHLLEAAERRAQKMGYHVMLDTAPSVGGTYHEHGKLRGWPVDGVLMWTIQCQQAQTYLGPQAADLPTVYLGNVGTCFGEAVMFDIEPAARQAAEHLLARGRRKLAYLFPYPAVLENPDSAHEGVIYEEGRYAAYAKVCRDAGLPLELVIMEKPEETREAGWLTGLALAARPASERPDAVLCLNDVVAQGVLFGLRRGGLRVPEDVAVVGCDGIAEGRFLETPLTTIVLDVETLCARGLDLLARRLKSRPRAPAGAGCRAHDAVGGGNHLTFLLSLSCTDCYSCLERTHSHDFHSQRRRSRTGPFVGARLFCRASRRRANVGPFLRLSRHDGCFQWPLLVRFHVHNVRSYSGDFAGIRQGSGRKHDRSPVCGRNPNGTGLYRGENKRYFG